MPEQCVMTHTPPFDFAQCETHDTTFALGERCKFDGREVWEVYAEEAQEQRGRAVRAEMEVEYLMGVLARLRSMRETVSQKEREAAAHSATGTAPQWLHDLAMELDALPTSQ